MISGNRRHGHSVALLLCVTLITLIAGSRALAANHRKSPVTISVVASGQRLAVHIRAASGSRCVLRVAAKHKSALLPAVYTSKRNGAAIAWTVPANAPSGEWAFVVVCRVGGKTHRATKRFLLINHGSGRGSLTERDSTKVLEGGLGGKGAGPCGTLAAPDQNGHCVTFPGDPFNYYEGGSDIGQCTWYAAGRRPDLWGITRGNAKTWLKEAAGHAPEGTVPVPGAIAVDEGGSWGHVAYVVGVSGPNVIVDDSNYWGDVTVHYSHPIPASHFAGYIYGGPAGNGPGSDGPGPAPGPGPGGGPSEPPSAAYGSMPAIAVGPSGLPTVVAQGPSNSLDAYWETPDAQWHGPLGIGAGGSTYSAPSIGASASGYPVVATEGPSNSLYVYWETSDAQWHGPLGIGGAGTTYSAPSVGVGSSGLPTVAVQGPSNSLDVYWETPDAQWHGPLGVGAGGSTYSAPSVTSTSTVVVQGPSNSLYAYWETPDAQWHGPLGIGPAGSTYSSPSAATTGSDLPAVAVQGPSNSLYAYWETPDAQWHGPLGIGLGGSTYSAPSVAVGSSGLPTVGAAGPSNSLDLYWETGDAQWHGPLGAGAGASTFSAPSLAASPSGLPVIATQGPSNSLYAYWETPDAQWHGPLEIGAGGSTF